VLSRHRSRFTLASKCGMAGVVGLDGVQRRVIDGRPEALRRTCEEALRRLRTDVIDLYYLHRWDKQVPIEDSVGALADLVRAGKVRAIGLSEVSAHTLLRAHAAHPIAAVQSEYSLWSRNPEIAVLNACRRIGAAFVAFSPLGRGFLAGAVADAASVGAWTAGDLRRNMPRFQGEQMAANLRWLDRYKALAQEASCTPAQLALAWLLHKGSDILPIPGTASLAHLREDLDAVNVTLAPALLARLEALVNQATVAGNRYSAATQAEIDTEEFQVCSVPAR
jgi:aryl-alcohol dehydrogenase-like predicted oxidoreductase